MRSVWRWPSDCTRGRARNRPSSRRTCSVRLSAWVFDRPLRYPLAVVAELTLARAPSFSFLCFVCFFLMMMISFCRLHFAPQCLRLPLSLKYDCTSPTSWRLAVLSLIQILRLGLPVVRAHPDVNVQSLWTEITCALDEFLFPKRQDAPSLNYALLCNLRKKMDESSEGLRSNTVPHPLNKS